MLRRFTRNRAPFRLTRQHRREEWFAWFAANYEHRRRAAIEEFVANYEHQRAEFWARWKPPKPSPEG
jgi:hypothetical protein